MLWGTSKELVMYFMVKLFQILVNIKIVLLGYSDLNHNYYSSVIKHAGTINYLTI